MIDTIRLSIEEGKFHIQEPDRFTPNAKSILGLGNGVQKGTLKAVLNPPKSKVKQGYYAPRLTLLRNPRGAVLMIEFSVPKLLYGNNFDEVGEADFPTILNLLRERLIEVGVYIFTELIRIASVSAIHYSKNIVLPKYSLCESVINLLSKAPVQQWYDTSKVDFQNDGRLYKVHSNSFEFALYDKVKDLKQAAKSEKRAYESDNAIQMDLFKRNKVSLETEVLRMELRLNNRRQIRRLLQTLGFPDDDLRFFALFQKEIAQRALLHYWKRYYEALPMVVMAQRESPSNLMHHLKRAFPQASMNTLLLYQGALAVIAESGWNGLQAGWRGSLHGFYQLKKALIGLQAPEEYPLSDLDAIETTLQQFEPVKLKTFCANEQKVINIEQTASL